jgi:predicted nucleic acid-binding protein
VTFSAGQAAVVMDASAIVELLSGDETWLDRWRAWTEAGAMILAPSYLGAEVANAMLRGIGLDPHATSNRIRQLFAMGLSLADRGLPGILGAVELADRHRLTVYDALYLELALDIDAELATLDRALAEAAESEGLAVTG